MSETLFAKIWNSHVVKEQENESSLIYIDRHLIHEVTSPQAFEGLRSNNRKVRRPDLTIATVDHNIPTTDRSLPILDETSSIQIKTLEQNCHDFDIKLFGKSSKNQGIVHVIGPQLGITLPGTTIVCGDSHTSTQGAFGAFAFGIGTSDVEHVLATQTLWLEKPKSFEIIATGKRKNSFTITSKDIILSIIRHIGTAGGTGHVLEYSGDAISELSMEQRMTICNMSIEGGSRAGLIAPDAKTLEYIKNRPYAPKGENWNMAVNFWKTLPSDEGSTYDKKIDINGSTIVPQVTWGTSPQDLALYHLLEQHPEDLCPM
jgi:3-isopropylmalate/(R)-2-methylmalate dehydratase large subunit